MRLGAKGAVRWGAKWAVRLGAKGAVRWGAKWAVLALFDMGDTDHPKEEDVNVAERMELEHHRADVDARLGDAGACVVMVTRSDECQCQLGRPLAV